MDAEHWQQLGLLAVTASFVIGGALTARHCRSGLAKLSVVTTALSVAAYVTLVVIAVFEKKGAEVSKAAFGLMPLGIPWYCFVPLLFLVLGLPAPIFIRRLLAEKFLEFGVIKPDELPSHWQRGDTSAKWALAYLVFLAALWIAYAATRGI